MNLEVFEVVVLGTPTLRSKVLAGIVWYQIQFNPLPFVIFEESKWHGVDAYPGAVLDYTGGAHKLVVRA